MDYGIYKLLNEGQYIQTDESDDRRAGHTNANTSELIASLVAAAISYEDGLSDMLHDMPADRRQAALEALRGAIMAASYNGGTEYAAYLQQLYQRVAAAANS